MVMNLRAPLLAIAALLLASPLAAQTLTEGIDVSRFQTAIDWNAVDGAGIEFAFIRATRGEGYVDPLFLANIRGASAAGVLAGPYHFARLNTDESNPNDAINEANHYLSVIKPYYDSGMFLPPVVDIEQTGFPSSPTAAKISTWTQKFSDTIFNALGIRPIIYTSESPANTYFTSAIASTHELWAAKYSSTPPSTPAWGPYQFWQYTNTGSVAGISGAVDRDRYNGSVAQLNGILHGNGPVGAVPTGRVGLTNFDGADFDSTEADGIEGYFSNSPTFSGTTTGVNAAGTTATRVTTEAQFGPASQEIFADAATPGGAWTIRHLSGFGASPATAAANLPLESDGFIGFWLKTLDPGVTVQLLIDDTPSGLETSTVKSVVADGQWRLYEWDFNNAGHWNSYVSGNGTIDGAIVTMDSILFKGVGDSTIYLDTVAHNPLGSLEPRPGDFNDDYLVDGQDLAIWRAAFGAGGAADADDDGDSDGSDFLLWQRNVGSSGVVAAVSAVPEPATLAMGAASLTACLVWSRRRWAKRTT